MVPKGWTYPNLGKVAELQRGFDLPTALRIEGSVPIISSAGYSGFHNEAKVKGPGVVTGRYGSIGEVFLVAEDFWPLNTSLWVKNFNGNDPRFIYYMLCNFDFKKFSDKTGVPGVNRNDLHAVKVGVPPLPEQRKIAQILLAWDKAITTTERLLANKQQQKKALMQRLLTGKQRFAGFEGEWVSKTLEQLCYINPTKTVVTKDTDVSFIPMDAVSEDAQLIRQDIKVYEEVEKGFTSFIDNDVLVAKITPCFENGKGALVERLCNGIGFGSTEFHVLRAKDNVCAQFLYYLTVTPEFRIRGEANMQGSAGQKRVTTDYLRTYTVYVPSCCREQQKIASILKSTDSEIGVFKQQLDNLKLQKKALMQQLLTGKRRVKVDEAAA